MLSMRRMCVKRVVVELLFFCAFFFFFALLFFNVFNFKGTSYVPLG